MLLKLRVSGVGGSIHDFGTLHALDKRQVFASLVRNHVKKVPVFGSSSVTAFLCLYPEHPTVDELQAPLLHLQIVCLKS